MSLHLTADSTAPHTETACVVESSSRTSTPTREVLFDVIQVCEISLSVASRHQFDAWVRGPLNSLIPHSRLLVWTASPASRYGDLDVLGVDAGGPGQANQQDTTRLASELRRRWRLAGRVPLLLEALGAGSEAIPRFPAGSQMLVHGIEPLFGGVGSLFALFCKNLKDNSSALFISQLIAPYLRLALDRIDQATETTTWRPPIVSIPTTLVTLTAREIGILEYVRDGKTNAEIGAVLIISPLTVKSHLQRVFRKLEVSTRTQAVATALSLKILEHGRQRTAQFKP